MLKKSLILFFLISITKISLSVIIGFDSGSSLTYEKYIQEMKSCYDSYIDQIVNDTKEIKIPLLSDVRMEGNRVMQDKKKLMEQCVLFYRGYILNISKHLTNELSLPVPIPDSFIKQYYLPTFEEWAKTFYIELDPEDWDFIEE